MRKLSSNCCPSSVERCNGMTEETESCTLESAVRGHHVYKTTWSPAVGQVLQVGRGVAFPGARGHFNYANLFFAKCFSLANSQKFDSRINNRLYGSYVSTEYLA